MIFVSVFDKKRYRYSQSHDLRCGNSQPYAVYSQDKGKYQHGYHLESSVLRKDMAAETAPFPRAVNSEEA